MSYITPRTNIYLYSNCPLPSNYEHTFYFANESAQTSYFAGLNPTPYNNNTYQVMSSGVVRIKDSIDNLYDKSYMSFVNTKTSGTNPVGFENKTYYCFVTDVIYINNGTTEIHYTIDVIQTYLFDFTKLSNGTRVLDGTYYIDRTHIKKSDDKISNKIMMNDEGLDVGIDMYSERLYSNAPDENISGDKISAVITCTGCLIRSTTTDSTINEYLVPVIRKVVLPNDGGTIESIVTKNTDNYVWYYSNDITPTRNRYGADQFLVNPFTYYYFDLYNDDGTVNDGSLSSLDINTSSSGFLGFIRTLQIFNALGKTDSIVNIKLIPSWIRSKHPQSQSSSYTNVSNILIDSSNNPIRTDINIGGSVNGYTPSNKKLLTYPYNYIVVDNNDNQNKIYKPQLINDNTNKLKLQYMSVLLSGEVVAYPVNYMDVANYDYGLSKNVTSEIPFLVNQFVEWYANNKISMNLAIMNHANTTGMNLAGSILGSGSGLQSGQYQTATKDGVTSEQFVGGSTNNFLGTQSGTQISGGKGFITKSLGATAGTISNSANFISGLMQQVRQMGEVPNTVKGSYTETLRQGMNRTGFTIYRVQLCSSVAERIDHYFSVYGYKIMDWYSNPSLRVRSNWTFIKTAGCAIIHNNIPSIYEEAINRIFDNGITFWNDKENFKLYTNDFYNPD